MTQVTDQPRSNTGRTLLFVAAGVGAFGLVTCLGTLALLLASGLLGRYAQAPTPMKPKPPITKGWRLFDGAEWGFQVDLPSSPVSQQRTTPKGRRLDVFYALEKEEMFAVHVSSPTSEWVPPKKLLRDLQAKAYTQGEQFLFDQFVELAGADACKELHFVDKDKELTMVRLVVANGRLYQVVFSGSPDDLTSLAPRRFLDSFQLVK